MFRTIYSTKLLANCKHSLALYTVLLQAMRVTNNPLQILSLLAKPADNVLDLSDPLARRIRLLYFVPRLAIKLTIASDDLVRTF